MPAGADTVKLLTMVRKRRGLLPRKPSTPDSQNKSTPATIKRAFCSRVKNAPRCFVTVPHYPCRMIPLCGVMMLKTILSIAVWATYWAVYYPWR